MYPKALLSGLAWLLMPLMAWAQAPKIGSTEWLAANPAGETLKIVDLREKITDYWAGHIAGAQWVSLEALRWPEDGVPAKIIPHEQLGKLLSRMGVTRDTTLVMYAEESNFRPAYLAWALDYLGHKDWVILDGGMKKWAAEQRPVTQEYPKVASCPCFTYIGPHPVVRVPLASVLARDPAKSVLLDVRARKLYTGEEGAWQRKGHIPGAVWHFWGDDLKPDGTWKSKAELLAGYDAIGVTADKQIIASCGQGQMSAHTYVTLKYILGFANVCNYDGGFQEWQSVEKLPVKTGEKP